MYVCCVRTAPAREIVDLRSEVTDGQTGVKGLIYAVYAQWNTSVGPSDGCDWVICRKLKEKRTLPSPAH